MVVSGIYRSNTQWVFKTHYLKFIKFYPHVYSELKINHLGHELYSII